VTDTDQPEESSKERDAVGGFSSGEPSPGLPKHDRLRGHRRAEDERPASSAW